ncbi:hypothetical protein BASA82_000053 [Batrachochytrium salamandrivorans]|nr:hypothetical protein BASA82_000053 [Batrachochytrium salamandrivorans]
MQDFVQDACKTFVDGTLSSAQFDEQCAALFGNKSYFCSTLDKLVGQICKLAQGLINEDKAMKMVEISKRFQPSSIASCIEFRRSTLEALQFPRNCACVAVLVTRKQPHCLVLESSAQLPGTFDENKLVMEFFEPAQVDFAPPSPSGRGGWRREATTYTLSVFSSRWYSADEDGFKTSKQNQLILKTLKSAAAAAGGAEQESGGGMLACYLRHPSPTA